MIYQDAKRFLKRHLQKPSREYEWSGHDNFVLLNFIQGRYSDAEIENNVSELRQAFRDFFEPVGTLVIRYNADKGVAYKILPYHVRPENSRHLNDIINIIRKNRRSIEYPYQGRKDQIALLGKIRRHINASIIETDEAVNKKELVRYAIKQALELDPRDVVVHLKRKYIIKLFKKNDYLSSTAEEPAPKDEEERRFAGYNPDDLSEHYNELIDDIDLSAFLDDVMAELFATTLNFDEITNAYYEKNVLRLVRDGIAEELKHYVSENDDYIIGFAGYIFRNNFTQVHERIAIEILEKFSTKSANAEKFIDYYSGTINIHEGKKYIIPEIATPDGKRWNIQSVTAITNMWLRARRQQAKYEVQLKNLFQKYSAVSSRWEEISAQYEDYEQLLESLANETERIEKENSELRQKHKEQRESATLSALEELKISELLAKNQKKLEDKKQKSLRISKEKNDLKDEFKSTRNEYLEMKKNKQYLESEIHSLKNNLDIHSDSFHSILASLVKALTQRKKLVVE
jgi:hypothetical protein